MSWVLPLNAASRTGENHVDVPFLPATWHSVGAPHQTFFVVLLIVFEATVGVTSRSGISADPVRRTTRSTLLGPGRWIGLCRTPSS